MIKTSIEERIAAIQEVEEGESISSAARRYKISQDTLSYNVKQYQEFGIKGLQCHSYNLAAKQKYEILKYMHENELSFKETAIKFGIGGA